MVRNLSVLVACLHVVAASVLAATPQARPEGEPSKQSAPDAKEQGTDAEKPSPSKADRKAKESQEEGKKDKDKPVKRTFFAAPMENETGQKQYEPVAAGLTDLVSVLLAQERNVTVVERQKLEELTREQALSLKGLTAQEYAIQAGKLLEADTVLTGRLFLLDRKLTVSIKALEISTARVVAADQISCRPEYLMEAALQLARKLAGQMAMPLPEIDLKAIDASPIAGLHFAQALSHYYAGDMDAAIMQLMRTIDLDPDYTEVHYWIGMCHYRLGEWPHAVIEWEKLIKRRPKSDLAKAVKGLLEEAKAHEKESPVEKLGPEQKAPWKAKEKVGHNPDAAGRNWLPPLRGGTQTCMHYDNGEDYKLKTEVTWENGKVVERRYFRDTLVDGRRRRTRATTLTLGPGGAKNYHTTLSCYQAKPEWSERYSLKLGREEMVLWFAEQGSKYGLTPELSGDPCPLDDFRKVPDSALDKYAYVAYRDFDEKKRLTYMTRREPTNWYGMLVKNVKCAYGENPDFPSQSKPRNPQDELRKLNTWKSWRRTQPVDDEGHAEKGAPRYVAFLDGGGGWLVRVVMEMDYDAQPRPKIKSYTIRHQTYVDGWGQRTEHAAAVCRLYKVEIEEVTDGDPALQGEWVKRVIIPQSSTGKGGGR